MRIARPDVTTTGFTIRDLDCFPDDERYRYEIIDGELHVTKAPDWDHQRVSRELILEIGNWDRDTGLGVILPAPGLVFAADDAVIPDLVWVRKERIDSITDAAGHFTSAPEIAIEVLSSGSANQRRDRELKLAVYNRWAVPEYWIIDREGRQVLVYRREGTELRLAETLGESDTLTSPQLPGFSCPVSSLFAGLPS